MRMCTHLLIALVLKYCLNRSFVYDFCFPFDNKLAERNIRGMKVRQRISGRLRSGAKTFCRIRSYFSTVRETAIGALDAISRAFTGVPFVSDSNTSRPRRLRGTPVTDYPPRTSSPRPSPRGNPPVGKRPE